MPRLIALVVSLLLGGAPLIAQEVPGRVATVTAGIGNNMGWLGVQGERYFARERLSAFLGLGYTPSVDTGDPTGPTFALGLRGYTGGIKHRGFLALSVSQLFVEAESARTAAGSMDRGWRQAISSPRAGDSPSCSVPGSATHPECRTARAR
jgi:hypothetical protein